MVFKSENLKDKIIFFTLLYDEQKQVGYRMLYVKNKFSKEDAFDWATKKADEVKGVITSFNII